MCAQAVRIFEPKESGAPHDLPQRTIIASQLGEALFGGIKQFEVERLVIKCAPDSITAEGLDCFNSRFSSAALLSQGLDELQSVEAIGVSRMISEGDNF